MARLVRHEKTGPIKLDPKELPQDKSIFICGCGLSRNFPFCDGTHKACRDERPGTLYVYDPETGKVIEERPEA